MVEGGRIPLLAIIKGGSVPDDQSRPGVNGDELSIVYEWGVYSDNGEIAGWDAPDFGVGLPMSISDIMDYIQENAEYISRRPNNVFPIMTYLLNFTPPDDDVSVTVLCFPARYEYRFVGITNSVSPDGWLGVGLDSTDMKNSGPQLAIIPIVSKDQRGVTDVAGVMQKRLNEFTDFMTSDEDDENAPVVTFKINTIGVPTDMEEELKIRPPEEFRKKGA